MSSFNGDALGSLMSEVHGQTVLNLLADMDTLQEVSLVNNTIDPHFFNALVPPFHNLSKLELLGLNQEYHDRDIEVAKLLISCPHIRELALSTAGWATNDHIDLLPRLVQHYRGQTNVRLRLRSLRLGYGFLPIQSPSEYLPELADITLLNTLRLDNDNVCTTTVVIDAPIDVKQFASAQNVTSLTAERLSYDIVELICQLNVSGQLTTLSLPRLCDTQRLARMDEENEYWFEEWYGEDGYAEPPQWEPAQMFSEPLEHAGKHWKDVLIGDVFRTEWLDDCILDCIATYAHIEVLTLPLHAESWPRFRDDIMPKLPHLQLLFLVGGKMAGTRGYPGFAVSDDEIYSFKTPEQQREQLIKQRDNEYAAHATSFARDVFHANRDRIAKGENCAVLRFLGLGNFVFTCVSPSAASPCGPDTFDVEDDGKSRRYQAVLLDDDEANAFESMKEYIEEIEELRMGGDERGPAW